MPELVEDEGLRLEAAAVVLLVLVVIFEARPDGCNKGFPPAPAPLPLRALLLLLLMSML